MENAEARMAAVRARRQYYKEHPDERPFRPQKKKPKPKMRTADGKNRLRMAKAMRDRIEQEAKIKAARSLADEYDQRPAINVELPDHLTDEDQDPPRVRDMKKRLFAPTPSQRVLVAGLSAFGVPREGISAYIKVSEDTLSRYFRYELAEGRARTEAALVAVMLVKALSGNISAVSMLLKCGFGWTETGKSDAPATLEALTVDQRLVLIESIRTSLASEETRGTGGRKNKANLVSITGTADKGNRE